MTVGGLIYYIGGLEGWPGPQADTVYIYDPATDSFSRGRADAAGPGARAASRCTAAKSITPGVLYADGEDVSSTEAVGWFDVYDPVTDTWASLPEMPRVRDHFHAAVVDGVFYAIGGRDTTINATNPFVDAFDFATQTLDDASH